jgi:hypothetical protein
MNTGKTLNKLAKSHPRDFWKKVKETWKKIILNRIH